MKKDNKNKITKIETIELISLVVIIASFFALMIGTVLDIELEIFSILGIICVLLVLTPLSVVVAVLYALLIVYKIYLIAKKHIFRWYWIPITFIEIIIIITFTGYFIDTYINGCGLFGCSFGFIVR